MLCTPKGGKFTVSMTLFFLFSDLLSHNVESTVIVDDNDILIEIDNVQEFFDPVKNKYATASNIHSSEYKKLTPKEA